ncbi:MAG TPA: DNA-binding protein WhiA [Firmicutes bacterium]|nr:DNA-binding protein WhiA [Bacillota bacterium]
MAFSYDVREELAGLPLERDCCRRAELAGLILTDALVDHSGLRIRASHALLARRTLRLWRSLTKTPLVVYVRRSGRLGGSYEYQLCSGPQGVQDLAGLGLAVAPDQHSVLPGPKTLAARCCRRSFLRGIFLARGFLSDPARAYQAEIVVGSERVAALIQGQLEFHGLRPKVRRRRSGWVVYLQEAEQISNFLGLIGASGAMLAFENQRLLRQMRSEVNRLVNSETANVSKVVAASWRQQEKIRWLLSRFGVNNLSPALAEIARLRLLHPEASLRELGQLLNPPASKSAVNHRLRRLLHLADTLGYVNDEPGGG